MPKNEKIELKNKVLSMFNHAFDSYMKYAYPSDELMPLSCKGRYRSKEFSRGDIDEVLGNYSLTLVDSLDTLALLGQIDEFEIAVKNVIASTHFDRDLVISVFESTIRMLGGLIGGHVSLIHLRDNHYPKRFKWYKDELLLKAKDLGLRLLPAFNTSTGLPMSRINLKYGITPELLSTEKDKFTCTACAGTLLLEFSILSRLTGEKIFEEKVRKTMDIIWDKRNRASDLVGTIINVNNGEWSVKDSGIGAGIDSYYEYLFKGYILLGDETFLKRFNQHYDSLSKYMNLNPNDGFSFGIGDGSFLKTVHMHMPNKQAKNYIDALLAFWPGLQVLKGDIKGAIKMHETLNHIVQKHDFLPEAVLFDHSIYWGNHPLRPEFLESTYYLYKATKDEHYLQIAKNVLNQLEKYSRVKCGYAAIADLKTKQHEDRMDSFVLAETFKYLYLMFAEDDSLLFNIDDFLFTTEAHILPLDIKKYTNISKQAFNKNLSGNGELRESYTGSHSWKQNSCPSLKFLFQNSVNAPRLNITDETKKLRESVRLLGNENQHCKSQNSLNIDEQENLQNKLKKMPLRAADFVAGRKDHMNILNKMGIQLTTMQDGRLQLVHKTSEALNYDDAEMGILFMTEMLELSKQQNFQLKTNFLVEDYRPVSLVLLDTEKEYIAGPAQFGYDFRRNYGLYGRLLLADPLDACSTLKPPPNKIMSDKIIVAKRGSCMFIEKSRIAQKSGALGIIIIDNSNESSQETSPLFAMSGDGSQDVNIPSVFLFGLEGNDLLWNMRSNKNIFVFLGDYNLTKETKEEKTFINGAELALTYNTQQLKDVIRPPNSCKVSDRLKSVFSNLNQNKRNQCELNDFNQLKDFYYRFNKKKSLNSLISNQEEKQVKILVIDEAFEIIVFSNENRRMRVNINYLLEKIKSNDSNLEINGKTLKFFEILISNLYRKTNFAQLKSNDSYKRSLFNLIEFKLNKSNQLSQNDLSSLSELALELDINPDYFESVKVKTEEKSQFLDENY